MGGLQGKVAVVTGEVRACRGTWRRFAREGAKVIVADVAEAESLKLVQELKELGGWGEFVKTDVGRQQQYKRGHG